MAQTRAKSILSSVQERIVIINTNYRNPETLKSLGWEPDPAIDVNWAASCTDAKNASMSSDYSQFVNNDWVVKPIDLANHQLFSFDSNFINTFKKLIMNLTLKPSWITIIM